MIFLTLTRFFPTLTERFEFTKVDHVIKFKRPI